MVLIDLVFVQKLAPKQVTVFNWILFYSALLRANFVLLSINFALLTANVAQLKFMDCVLDFQIRIYIHTHKPRNILHTYICCISALYHLNYSFE